MMKSRFSDVTIPDLTIQDLIFSNIDRHGSKVALVDGITGTSFSYAELRRLSRTVASGLWRLGVRQGDVVALISPNSPNYAFILFGVLTCGAVVTTLNPAYTEREMEVQLRDCGAKYVYTVSEVVDRILHMAKRVPALKVVISDGGGGGGCTPFSELIEDDGSAFPTEVIDASNDTAFLTYSSGTTGLPKGVMMTHRNFVANVIQCMHPGMLTSQLVAGDNEASHVVLAFLPFFHAYAIICYMCKCLFAGCVVVILPKFEPRRFLSAIQRYKVTYLFLVPPVVMFLTASQLVAQFDLTSLRFAICSAAPLSKAVEEAFNMLFPQVLLTQSYGLSEAILVFLPTIDCPKRGSVGAILPNVEIKVKDSDSGVELEAGVPGEIWVRGPSTMKGYLHRPEATRDAIDADGWLCTGDMGYYDTEGYFYIVDRIKEIIKVKGCQVAPAELEALLLTHPLVADVGVIGVFHERNGEVPKAFVVPRLGHQVSAPELHAFMKDKVTSYKQLNGGIEFVEAIPKSASGKILRHKLRESNQLFSSI